MASNKKINEKSFEPFGNLNQFLRNKEPIELCNKFLEMVFFIKNLKNQDLLWFRGLSNENYPLVPRLHRILGGYNKILENDLHTKFVIKSRSC